MMLKGTNDRPQEDNLKESLGNTREWFHTVFGLPGTALVACPGVNRSGRAFGAVPKRHETFPICPIDLVDVLVDQLDLP